VFTERYGLKYINRFRRILIFEAIKLITTTGSLTSSVLINKFVTQNGRSERM
jgi:hypothetical protein